MKVPESIEECRVHVMSGEWSPESVIEEMVREGAPDEPFYVMDVGEVVRRYNNWTQLMPRVEPYYAVKCNDDKVLVSTLAALGTGFDCASKAEMELVTSLGVTPERIIFANPAKMSSHIRRADALGVHLMTFDSEVELLKIKHLMPHAQLVIRIRCDATDAQCPLGIKFGCDPLTEAPKLLKVAAVHGLNVMGVSFHVGSGAGSPSVYARAVAAARAVADCAHRLGHDVRLLDIGGGFPGGKHTDITQVSRIINEALSVHFPSRSVRVIAEPGRYFAAAAYTLAAMVHSAREIESKGSEGEAHTMYFINDGVYGSFNCLLYDHQHITVKPLKCDGKPTNCSVWGPSCDGLDVVIPSTVLPAQPLGAWLAFPDMGAYTLPVASPFNGFPVPSVRYCIDHRLWCVLKELSPAWAPRLVSAPPSPPPSPSPAPWAADDSPHYIECALK